MKVMNQKIMWLYDHMCKRLLGNSWNLPLEDDNVEHIEVGQIEALMMQVFKKTAADLMVEYDDQLPGVRVLLKILLTFRSFENMLKSRSFDDQHVIMDWRETRSLAKLYIDAYYTTPDEQQGRPGDLDVSGMYFADRGPALKLTSEYGARGTAAPVEEPAANMVIYLPKTEDQLEAENNSLHYAVTLNKPFRTKHGIVFVTNRQKNPYLEVEGDPQAVAAYLLKDTEPMVNKYGTFGVTIYMQPGEPFFVLLGRDPQAPDLIEAWAADRLQMEEGNPKATQAFEIAAMMRAYKDANPDVGMPAVLYNNFLENGDLIQLAPRNRKYNAEEILKMAMTVAEAAVEAEVELNVKNNTCFVHPSVTSPVEQQLGHVSKIAQVADKNVLIMLMEDGRPKQIWGSFDTALTYFGHEALQDIEYFAPGEYPESEDQESFVVPG